MFVVEIVRNKNFHFQQLKCLCIIERKNTQQKYNCYFLHASKGNGKPFIVK